MSEAPVIYVLWRREHDGSDPALLQAFDTQAEAEAVRFLLTRAKSPGKIIIEPVPYAKPKPAAVQGALAQPVGQPIRAPSYPELVMAFERDLRPYRPRGRLTDADVFDLAEAAKKRADALESDDCA